MDWSNSIEYSTDDFVDYCFAWGIVVELLLLLVELLVTFVILLLFLYWVIIATCPGIWNYLWSQSRTPPRWKKLRFSNTTAYSTPLNQYLSSHKPLRNATVAQ